MSLQDPVITVRDLLSNNWDNTNTSISYDASIHTGWHTTEADRPQVTVTNPSENPIDGGETGYSAIDPDGSGGVQDIQGNVNVDTWSDRGVEDSVNPKKLTYEFTEEVKRIIDNHQLNQSGLRILAYQGRTFVPPAEEENPPVFHQNVRVRYHYEDRP